VPRCRVERQQRDDRDACTRHSELAFPSGIDKRRIDRRPQVRLNVWSI
jgi:hypothetical protein